ncbi:GNAT family N-acetyltransferase [Streptomyces capparidis]
MQRQTPRIGLIPWSDTEADLELLRLSNTPEMTAHVGGPETEQGLRDRHRRYTELTAGTGRGQMFRVVLLPGGQPAGIVGYWERRWREEMVYEAGWSVLPEHQGRGIAAAAVVAAVAAAREEKRHRHLHAFPSVSHPASNGVCRRAGFTLLEECEFEYPPGHFMRCNDWRAVLAD